MDIFAYIEAMLAAGTTTAYFCLGILAFFALAVLWELFHGLRRGLFRQLSHTVFMLVSAAASFFITKSFVATLFGDLANMTVEEILAAAEGSGATLSEDVSGLIASFDAETLQHILALPISLLVAPVMFALLFIVINLIGKLISFIICKIARVPKGHGVLSRLLGLAIGAAEGALVAAIVLLPISGITTSLDSAMDTLRADEASTEIVAAYDEVMAPVAECPIFPLINSVGGDAILTSLATVDIDGEAADLRGELSVGVKLYAEGMKLEGVDFKALTADDKSAIEGLIGVVNGSDYLTALTSGLFRGIAFSADEGYINVGAEPPFDKLIDTLFDVFKTSSKDNLAADLDTIKEVLYILSDDGVLLALESEEEGAIEDALASEDVDGNTAIRRLIAIINENEHTRPLVATLTEISVAILCEDLGVDGDTAELYENVKAGVEDVLSIKSDDYANDDEYVEAISASLNETLTANNIELKPEIIDTMADYIKDNHKDLENITDEEINDVLLSYYDAYLEYIQSNPEGEPNP